MILGAVFERFVEHSPVAVMARGVLENALSAEQVDAIFERAAERQYTRALLFSSVSDLMCQVVLDQSPSVRAAYQKQTPRIGVSITSVYNKLDGLEPAVSRAVVCQTARRLAAVVGELGAAAPPPLSGFRTKILDGNHLAGTEHRIAPLRTMRAGALPGQTLVVLDPALRLAIDVVPCEDGHAQERALVRQILPAVQPHDLWIADRNFCTTRFVFGVALQQAAFLVRQHASTLTIGRTGARQRKGRTTTGTVFEQRLSVSDPESGRTLSVRRITIELDQPTRDGQAVIHLRTNVPVRHGTALRLAELYRRRWTIETLFQDLTQTLCCEIRTLGYPRAALFAFCLALVAWNAVSLVQAALRAVHGAPVVQRQVSGYYLALEIAQATPGMLIAIPPEEWTVFRTLPPDQLAHLLRELARRLVLSKYQKHPRGPKKSKPGKTSGARIKHVATARILAHRNDRH